METIGIVGVGAVGSALGERLTATGYRVVFGVRPGREIDDLLAKCRGQAHSASVPEACAAADLIFLAVPHEVAVQSLEGADLTGKVVVDCNNPVTFEDGPILDPPSEGSITAQLAAAYPSARWVKGFATFGAAIHRDPILATGPAQTHLAGDDQEAKETVAELARKAGFDPLDAGPLRNAALLESLAILWIHLAMNGIGKDVALQAVGRG